MPIVSLLSRLVAFDTTSVLSNLALIGFVEERLRAAGLEVERYASEDGRKANLLATLGPLDVGGLMLAGHTDVVPVEGQAWSSDPFTLREAEGRCYGRGTADMKGFLALAILAAEAVRHRRLKLPLHLAFTYDEETGCQGAALLMRRLKAAGRVLPRCAVIGEPSNFQVFRMHKGIAGVRVRFRGVEGHSGKPRKGANAIYPAAQVVARLVELEAELEARRSMESEFEVPYTTVSVGRLRAGTALNIIPNHAELLFEYRTMPGEDPDYVLNQVMGYIEERVRPAFQARHPDARIELQVVTRGAPMLLPPGSEIEALALELTGARRATAAPYYSEGAEYVGAGIPTVLCGPGDIDQAHRPDEYVTHEQLQRGLPLLARLIERVCLPQGAA